MATVVSQYRAKEGGEYVERMREQKSKNTQYARSIFWAQTTVTLTTHTPMQVRKMRRKWTVQQVGRVRGKEGGHTAG